MVLNSIRRIAVGVSGGVDSTVSGLLLKQNKKYEVIGVFMKNWDLTDENGVCTADKDAEEAENICKRLEIQFKQVNFVKEYWNEVFENLIESYTQGKTPNPDILCNRNIKFNHFHRHCIENLECDAIATGHYARSSYGQYLENANPNENVKLLKAADRIKDQTFFLAQISQQSLRNCIFPVGNLQKNQVKSIAKENGFQDIAEKKESMGICFISKRKNGFQKFIDQYIEDNPGDIVNIETDKVIGFHKGIHHWTVGQTLKMSGVPHRLIVVNKHFQKNILYVCEDIDHPSLYTHYIITSKPHWIDKIPHGLSKNNPIKCQFRFQNKQPLSNCIIKMCENNNKLIVEAIEPQIAVTPGQFVVFYSQDECLGSSIIDSPGQSLFLENKLK